MVCVMDGSSVSPRNNQRPANGNAAPVNYKLWQRHCHAAKSARWSPSFGAQRSERTCEGIRPSTDLLLQHSLRACCQQRRTGCGDSEGSIGSVWTRHEARYLRSSSAHTKEKSRARADRLATLSSRRRIVGSRKGSNRHQTWAFHQTGGTYSI